MAQNRNQIVSSCDGREKVFKHGVRNFGNGGNSIKRIVHYKRVKKISLQRAKWRKLFSI